MQTIQSISIGMAAVALIASLATIPMFLDQPAEAKNMEKIRIQKTSASHTDQFPGHESHDIMMIFPPEEGVLYSGTLTFSSSYPVEVVVFHDYEQPEDGPANIFQVDRNGKRFAFSLLMLGEGGDDKIRDMEGGVRSASIPFVGSGLALHTLDGTQFTATYSVDGWKRTLQN
jgi:hypothetical protein